jgi:HK97 gp10 family phage protein
MMATLYKVDGLKALQTALQELPKATGRNVMQRTLIKAAKPIEAAAIAKVPVATGQLKESITTSTRLTRRQRGQHQKRSLVEVFVGSSSIGTLVEYGTHDTAPQPFMRPAFDGNKQQALNIIKTEMGTEIAKAAQRLAKKAAKAAR